MNYYNEIKKELINNEINRKVKNYSIWIVLLKLCYGLLMLYFLCDLMVSNRQGELPYRFLWQLEEYF